MFPANENIAILFESFKLWQDELIEQACVSLHWCLFFLRVNEATPRETNRISAEEGVKNPNSGQTGKPCRVGTPRVKVLGGHALHLARFMSASETGPLYTRAKLIARVNRTLCAGSLYRANTFGRYEWPVAWSVRSTRINLPEKEKVKKGGKNRKRTGTESKIVVAIGRFIVCALPGCNSS